MTTQQISESTVGPFLSVCLLENMMLHGRHGDHISTHLHAEVCPAFFKLFVFVAPMNMLLFDLFVPHICFISVSLSSFSNLIFGYGAVHLINGVTAVVETRWFGFNITVNAG